MAAVVEQGERPREVAAHVAEGVVADHGEVAQRVAGLPLEGGDLLPQTVHILRQLVGPDGPAAEAAGPEELRALMRGAITRAVADGADTVWLRTGHTGVRQACRAAGFRLLDEVPGGSARGDIPGDDTRADDGSPSSLLVWKADRSA